MGYILCGMDGSEAPTLYLRRSPTAMRGNIQAYRSGDRGRQRAVPVLDPAAQSLADVHRTTATRFTPTWERSDHSHQGQPISHKVSVFSGERRWVTKRIHGAQDGPRRGLSMSQNDG